MWNSLDKKTYILKRDIVIWRILLYLSRETYVWKSLNELHKINLSLWPSSVVVPLKWTLYIVARVLKKKYIVTSTLETLKCIFHDFLLRLLGNSSHLGYHILCTCAYHKSFLWFMVSRKIQILATFTDSESCFWPLGRSVLNWIII